MRDHNNATTNGTHIRITMVLDIASVNVLDCGYSS